MSGFPYVSFVPASACVDLGLQVRHARGNGIGFLARTGLYKEIEFGVSYISLGCGGFSLLACHIEDMSYGASSAMEFQAVGMMGMWRRIAPFGVSPLFFGRSICCARRSLVRLGCHDFSSWGHCKIPIFNTQLDVHLVSERGLEKWPWDLHRAL